MLLNVLVFSKMEQKFVYFNLVLDSNLLKVICVKGL